MLNFKFTLNGEKIYLGNLSQETIRKLLLSTGDSSFELRYLAANITKEVFNNNCFLRAVIEFSNECNINCRYCLMQRENKDLIRYHADVDSIFERILLIKSLGIRTIMFQSGESRSNYDLIINFLDKYDLSEYNILLCIGNLSSPQIKHLKKLKVHGVMIKFETLNNALFKKMQGRNLATRLRSIIDVKRQRLQTSSGNIVGLPGQNIDDLICDLLYLQYLKLPMNSASPFIPAHGSKLEGFNKPNIELVLNYLALLRLANPFSLIPSVSALNLLQKDGQDLGLKSGANVLTCNFTKKEDQEQYKIYNDKRVVVEYDNAVKMAIDNGLTPEKGWALGPKYIEENAEQKWFDMRYSDSSVFESAYGKSSDFFIKSFIPLLKKEFKVIDLGGGDGRNSIPIAKKVNNILSIDNNLVASKRVEKRKEYQKVNNIEVKSQNILEITNFKEYDVIILSNVIYYFEKDKVTKLLNNILESLNNKKYLYLSFETNIFMSHELNKQIMMSSVFNYTIADIIEIIENNTKTKILKVNQSEHDKKLPLNLENVKGKMYNRKFLLCELIVTGR